MFHCQLACLSLSCALDCACITTTLLCLLDAPPLSIAIDPFQELLKAKLDLAQISGMIEKVSAERPGRVSEEEMIAHRLSRGAAPTVRPKPPPGVATKAREWGGHAGRDGMDFHALGWLSCLCASLCHTSIAPLVCDGPR